MVKNGILTALLGFCVVTAFADSAAAQWNNAPYTPSLQGAPRGIGMTSAYREAILRAEFFGERPRALIRANDGDYLLRVERRAHHQAFVRTHDSTFVIPANRVGGGTSGYGFAIGGFGVAFGSSPQSWIGLTDSAPVAWSGMGGYSGSTPINVWIGQVDSLSPS